MKRTPLLLVALLLVTLLPVNVFAHSPSAETLRRLDAELEEEETSPALLLQKGIVLAAKGAHEESLKVLERAAKLRPTDPHIAYHTGLTLGKLNFPHRAEQELARALHLGGPKANIHFASARLLEEAGNAEAAIKAYRLTIEHAPNLTAYLACGALLESLNRPAEALRLYQRGVKHTLGSAPLAKATHRLAMDLAQFEVAINVITPLLNQAEIKTRWLLLRAAARQAGGNLKGAQKDRSSALSFAHRLVERRPTALAYLERARAHLALKRSGEALADLKSSLKISPSFPEASRLYAALTSTQRAAK